MEGVNEVDDVLDSDGDFVVDFVPDNDTVTVLVTDCDGDVLMLAVRDVVSEDVGVSDDGTGDADNEGLTGDGEGDGVGTPKTVNVASNRIAALKMFAKCTSQATMF